MTLVDCLVRVEVFAAVLAVAGALFIWNGYRRVVWNKEWDANVSKVTIPEAMPSYDADDLMKFVRTAQRVTVRGEPALGYYADKILRKSDVGYAIGLTLITTYLWFRIAVWPTHPPDISWLSWLSFSWPSYLSWLGPAAYWLAPFFGAMAIAYGVADIAEDYKLADILWPKQHNKTDSDRYPLRVDRADAAAANMLTRIKMMSLFLSLIGGVLFYLISKLQSLAQRLSGHRGAGGTDGRVATTS